MAETGWKPTGFLGGAEWKRQQNADMAAERDRVIEAQQRQLENSYILQKKAMETEEFLSPESQDLRRRKSKADVESVEVDVDQKQATLEDFQAEAPTRKAEYRTRTIKAEEEGKTARVAGRALRAKGERSIKQDMLGMTTDELQFIAAAASTVGADPESFGTFQNILAEAGIDVDAWGLSGQPDRIPVNRMQMLREMAINTIDHQQTKELKQQAADAELAQQMLIAAMKAGENVPKEVEIYNFLKDNLGPQEARLYLRNIAVGKNQIPAKDLVEGTRDMAYTTITNNLLRKYPELQEVLASSDTEDPQSVMLQTQVAQIADVVSMQVLSVAANDPSADLQAVRISTILNNIPELRITEEGEALLITQDTPAVVNQPPASTPMNWNDLNQ